MTVHILGLGCVGTVIAHFLSKSAFIPTISYLSIHPRSPIILHTPTKQIHKFPPNILRNDVTGTSPFKTLFITTKAQQTRSAISAYIPRITDDTLLIFLQNGMGILESM